MLPFELHLVDHAEPHPSVPRFSDPGVESWRDERGEVCAIVWSTGARHFMSWPGVALYAFGEDGQPARAHPAPGASVAQVHRVFRRGVLPAAFQRLGWEALHASAVRTDSGLVVLCAASGNGKSTLAYACRRAGHPQWADDSIVLRLTDAGVESLALPFDVSLRHASTAHFHPDRGAALWQGPVERASPDLTPVAAFVTVERSGADSDLVLRRLEPAAAFEAILPHACTFTMADVEDRRRTLATYLEVCARVPAWALTYPSGLDRLPDVVAAVVGLVGPPATRSA